MWQEILVFLIVLAAAIFVGKRFWNSFKGLRTGDKTACGCDCSKCSEGEPSLPDCCSHSADRQAR